MEINSGIYRALVRFFGLVIALSTHAIAIFPQTSGGLAKLTYTRTFKGSTPEYLAIIVDSSGFGTYEGRKLDEAQIESPRALQLSVPTTQRIFDLARELRDFKLIRLESRRKVANLGEKTLAYQQGAEVNKVVFNYTDNRTAQDLVGVFEAVGAVEEHVAALEFEMKYDPLALSQELLQIEIELDDKSLIDPQLLAPTLEKIAHGSRYLHLAQTRAQQILDRVQPH